MATMETYCLFRSMCIIKSNLQHFHWFNTKRITIVLLLCSNAWLHEFAYTNFNDPMTSSMQFSVGGWINFSFLCEYVRSRHCIGCVINCNLIFYRNAGIWVWAAFSKLCTRLCNISFVRVEWRFKFFSKVIAMDLCIICKRLVTFWCLRI